MTDLKPGAVVPNGDAWTFTVFVNDESFVRDKCYSSAPKARKAMRECVVGPDPKLDGIIVDFRGDKFKVVITGYAEDSSLRYNAYKTLDDARLWGRAYTEDEVWAAIDNGSVSLV